MIFQCTKSLLDKCGWIPEQQNGEAANHKEDFYAWHVNLTKAGRSGLIVFMNNLTWYPIILYRPKAADFKNLQARFEQAVRETFAWEGILPEVIDRYLENCGKLRIMRTADRSMAAYLTKMCSEVKNFGNRLRADRLVQPICSRELAAFGVGRGGEYIYSRDELLKALSDMMGIQEPKDYGKILKVEQYVLKIQMEDVDEACYRRVRVPSMLTFAQLNSISLTLFDHSYFNESGFCCEKGVKERLGILDAAQGLPEDMDFDRIRDWSTCTLREIFESYDLCFWIYDWNLYWEHQVILEKTIYTADPCPLLLERKGTRPVEPDYWAMRRHFDEPNAYIPYPERECTDEEINRRIRAII